MRFGIATIIAALTTASLVVTMATAWMPALSKGRSPTLLLQAKQAGTFFNQVPDENDGSNDDDDDDDDDVTNKGDTSFELEKAMELLRQRQDTPPSPSKHTLASQVSATINGKPTIGGGGKGFGQKINPPGDSKPFVGIGPPMNDPTKPEYDDQGYTLYADEKTGKKKRVFEALVDYPCKFTMKIVGAQEGNFVKEMVAVVAESCQVKAETVDHSVRTQGKWVSVTVKAPVKSAEMLYSLYENVDKDPRVKFKF